MSLPSSGDEDRRRSPRFSCGGEAKIVLLPSNGLFLPCRIRDLSLGGCCVETASALNCGARAEMVVRVNSTSFRAMSQVRAIRGRALAGMEFVQLSVRGKNLLADVLKELARLRALMDQLRSAHRAAEEEMLRWELDHGTFNAILLNQTLPVIGAEPSREPREEPPASVESEALIVKAQPGIASVDLLV